jgi:hypothetical protein
MPFQKGVSGNPKGRPKKDREEEFQKILLSEVTPGDFRDMVAKAVQLAKKGEYQFMKLLFDYLIGPPVEKKEISGADGGAIDIKLIEVLIPDVSGDDNAD